MDARTLLLMPLLYASLACGRNVEQNAGLDASADGLVDGSDGDDEGESAEAGQENPPDAGPPPVLCNLAHWSESTGASPCGISATETCDDGNAYTVSCTCPAATCSCARGADAGRTFATVPFGQCPTCLGADAGQLFAACGAPY